MHSSNALGACCNRLLLQLIASSGPCQLFSSSQAGAEAGAAARGGAPAQQGEPPFFDEKSALKVCFSSLLRASQRWQRVRMTDWDRLHLERLRREIYGQTERRDASPGDLQRKEVA